MIEEVWDCWACSALQGSYDDSWDYRTLLMEENLLLADADPGVAARAWLAHFEQTVPHALEQDFKEICSEETAEEYYVLDIVMYLLHKARHPLFAPLPDWLPPKLALAAKRLAKLEFNDAKEENERRICGFVHDRLAPEPEWLMRLENPNAQPVAALGSVNHQLTALAQQVFKPALVDNYVPVVDEALLESLHTCKPQ